MLLSCGQTDLIGALLINQGGANQHAPPWFSACLALLPPAIERCLRAYPQDYPLSQEGTGIG